MKPFTTEVLGGHKGYGAEVPFDPAQEWGVQPVALWPGRRGFKVTATVNGKRCETAIVARSKRFWLLLDDAMLKKAGAAEGDRVKIAITPPQG